MTVDVARVPETGSAPAAGRRRQPTGSGRGRAGVQLERYGAWAGALLVVALAALDGALGADDVLTATFVLGPFLTGLTGGTRQTRWVALLACGAAVASGVWNHNAGDVAQIIRVMAVLAGSAFAVAGARARERQRAAVARVTVLANVAALTDEVLDVRQLAARLGGLVVPEVAVGCIIDVEDAGAPERLVELPAPDGGRGAGEEPVVRVVAALRTRGRSIGRLELLLPAASRDAQVRAEDDAFAQALADRIGLALQNAGLTSELRLAERQLGMALDGLHAAVLIQRPGRGIVYANQATAEMMGMGSAAQVIAATPDQIAVGWQTWDEHGAPVDPSRFPSRRLLAGERTVEPLVVRTVNRDTGREHWRLTKASAIYGADGVLEMTVSITEDISDIKHAELAQRLLADAGRALSSSLEYELTLQQVAQLAVPDLADWCSVLLPDDTGWIRPAAIAHSDPEKVQYAHEYHARFPAHRSGDSPSAAILAGAPARLVGEVSQELLRASITDAEQLAAVQRIALRSLIQVPIVAPSGRVLGVLNLVNAESARTFTTENLELAKEIGRRAGTAMEHARLHTERSQIAETLQRSLLPDPLQRIPGYAVASVYRPAGEQNLVGGDFFDAFPVPGGWLVVIGDITGHGAAAAALTARARHTLRAVGTTTGDPSQAAEHLNDLLLAQPELSLCTACLILLRDTEEGPCAHVVRAGHPAPVLTRAGHAEEVGEVGQLLGAWPGTFPAIRLALEPGDQLLLYTDGVTEARRGTSRFGLDRVLQAIHGSADEVETIQRLTQALDDFEDGPGADDTAILALRRLAPDG